VCFGFCYDRESDRWGLQEEEEEKHEGVVVILVV